MFVRTQRLTLRPGWKEDAPAIAQAIGHEEVCGRLTRAPWPYTLRDAEAFVAAQAQCAHPALLIFEHVARQVRLIGCIGLTPGAEGVHELGYWLTPSAWGQGYATEAARGVVHMARDSLRLKRLTAGHMVDNPASGRVLRKLGFRPTGRIVLRPSLARGGEVPCATFELDLSEGGCVDSDPHARMAA